MSDENVVVNKMGTDYYTKYIMGIHVRPAAEIRHV